MDPIRMDKNQGPPGKTSSKMAVEWHGFRLSGIVIGVTPQQPPIPLG